MEDLARAVKLAAQLREESWDFIKEKYKLSVYDAADKAVAQIGFDVRGTQPIYLLLQHCWNDILEWADSTTRIS